MTAHIYNKVLNSKCRPLHEADGVLAVFRWSVTVYHWSG